VQKAFAFLAAVAFTSGAASASTVLFAPDPSTGSNSPSSPPTSYTAGTPYTQTNANGGTITYSPTTFTVGDIASSSGEEAYISSTESVTHS
jgi:hypothetical protein